MLAPLWPHFVHRNAASIREIGAAGPYRIMKGTTATGA